MFTECRERYCFCAFGRNMMQHMASLGIVANVVACTTLIPVSVRKGERANQLGSVDCVKMMKQLIFVAEWRRKIVLTEYLPIMFK